MYTASVEMVMMGGFATLLRLAQPGCCDLIVRDHERLLAVTQVMYNMHTIRNAFPFVGRRDYTAVA